MLIELSSNIFVSYINVTYICNKMETTPFVFGKIVSGLDFTNRQSETERLLQNFNASVNTVLISPRRWGKSSLVKKATEQSKRKNPKLVFCFIDLFNIRTEQEFYEVYIRELIKVTSTKWEERIRIGKELFKKIIPKFSVGIDPMNDLSISAGLERSKKRPG